MIVGSIQFDQCDLMSKDELIAFLRENGADNGALSKIREQQHDRFGNELIWFYPISDGLHLGTFIAAVKEGFISLPYNAVDKYDGEFLELDNVTMFDEDAIQIFLYDWRLFSDDLISAMTDMLRILRDK